MTELLSPQRRIVIKTAEILQRLFCNFTLQEVAWMADLTPDAVKRQFHRLSDAGIIVPVISGGSPMKRHCRETGRLLPAWTIIEDAMVIVEDQAQATLDRITLAGSTSTGFNWDYEPILDRPTKALPGTPEKVEVMAQRYRRGFAAIHPADAGYDGRPLNARA